MIGPTVCNCHGMLYCDCPNIRATIRGNANTPKEQDSSSARQEFEEWAASQGFNTYHYPKQSDHAGSYILGVEWMWKAWQVAWALRAERDARIAEQHKADWHSGPVEVATVIAAAIRADRE